MKDNISNLTVLVSGASGIVGYGIVRNLKRLGCKVIGTTVYDVSPADCFSDIVIKAPYTSDESYFEWLRDIIKEYHIDMIIPGIEIDMNFWNKNRDLIEKTGTFLLLNNSELIDLCLDKWLFYCKLKDSGFKNCIDSSLDADYNRYDKPFIIKPRCGFGSKGLIKVDSLEVFEQNKERVGKELMIQQYVGTDDEEYTVSGFFDGDSKLRAMISMKRKLSASGYTDYARIADNDQFVDLINELAICLKPIGPTNFQFRHDGIEWRLLEINPRISSSTSIKAAFGYNEAEMAIRYFLLGQEISQPEIKRGTAIRYTEDYIIYDSVDI